MNDTPDDIQAPVPAVPEPAEGPERRAVDPKLLEILVCPLTKSTLRYDEQHQELISDKAGLAYPIRDGIPIMLVDEARELDPHERRHS
ncbi:MAG TPA: Trm112 family protein [Alphaproteobacteria bacterium]|jgi:uncharacterized protein YbaR (Trm112 family)|nr:Trm112 family protein [Alphaproteobacteria bacterium]